MSPSGSSEPTSSDRGPRPRGSAFHRLAAACAQAVGSPWAFITAVTLIVGWAVSGPIFHFGETWQLVINTLTTIITFLMVFLIQSSQNRDSSAVHLKLDELIRASEARNLFVDLEDASEDEILAIQREFSELRRKGIDPTTATVLARKQSKRKSGTGEKADADTTSVSPRVRDSG